MVTFLLLMLFPAVVGLVLSYLLVDNKKEEAKMAKLIRKNNDRAARMFRIRKTILIVCYNHLSKLQPNQVALLDAARCKYCVDKQGKA